MFGLPPEEKLVEDYSCWYDQDGMLPSHIYLTDKHLCIHIHGTKGKGQEEVISWKDICDVKKKNTAKVIPNAIAIVTEDHKEKFFSFINRHPVYKTLHFLWKGRDHSSDCLHEHDHSSSSTFSPIHPDHPEFKQKRALRESSVEDIPDTSIQPITSVTIESVYTMEKDLGSGAFSIVRLATHKQTHEKRAVKVIDKKAVKEKKEMLDREVDILKRIQHPNIIAVKEIYETSDFLYLVMELATGGELFDSIVSRGKYSEKDAARIVKQVTAACAYLHALGIVHRDLKPENLLLASNVVDAQIKIADFGLSKMMDASAVLQTACGTPGYVAPEVLTGEGYHQEVDIWSIGVIMYILLCGFPPFYADNNAKLFEKIMNGTYSFPSPYWDKVSQSAKDLIKHMLVVNPKSRYTTKQILEHPWILGQTASDADLKPALEQLKKHRSEESKVTVMTATSVARMALNS